MCIYIICTYTVFSALEGAFFLKKKNPKSPCVLTLDDELLHKWPVKCVAHLRCVLALVASYDGY
jgi:hypothetical protein